MIARLLTLATVHAVEAAGSAGADPDGVGHRGPGTALVLGSLTVVGGLAVLVATAVRRRRHRPPDPGPGPYRDRIDEPEPRRDAPA